MLSSHHIHSSTRLFIHSFVYPSNHSSTPMPDLVFLDFFLSAMHFLYFSPLLTFSHLYSPLPLPSRVASDCKIAELIYESLTAVGITVWFDKVNILPGRYWEQEFADGLLTSSCFVCLLSRHAINHPSKPAQNFNTLTSDSKADSVLMEWTLGTYVRASLLHS
jgi:TIR domain